MAVLTIQFFHVGQQKELEKCIQEVEKCGATILHKIFDPAESVILANVKNENDFMDSFMHTDSFSCSSLE